MNSNLIARNSNRRSLGSKRGFTLLEMMLVVTIIGLLAVVVVYNVAGRSQKARILMSMQQLNQLKSSLIEYNIDSGTYPPDLNALTSAGTKGYLDKVPLDQWKHSFYYSFPGSSGDPKRPFDLICLGPDGLASTTDDIDVWTMGDQPGGGGQGGGQ